MYLQQKKRAHEISKSECPPDGILPRASSLGTPMYTDPVSGGMQFCLLEIYSMRKTHFRIALRFKQGEEMANPGAVRERLELAVRHGKWIS